MRILLIEDEPHLRAQVGDTLRQRGYAVDVSGEGDEGLYMGREYPVDLAIVDLGLPGLDGIEIIRRWRSAGLAFPILILTARGQWQDKVEGLEAGGDDYLAKPFHMQELLARVRALVRRAGQWTTSVLTCGALQVDTASQEVLMAGTAVRLTAYEYRLLEYLMLHAGRVVSKTELTEHCYDEGSDRDSNVLEVLVGRLRRKLDPNGERKPIETLRGRGYRLAAAHSAV
jgi:two-component system response regulator PhoP